MSESLHWLDGIDHKKSKLTLHQTLLLQLSSAIEQGVLKAGDKLPTHRELASILSIAVATVSKVYKEAERKGLISSKVGKGSFVSSYPVLPQAIKANDIKSINLSIIKPQVNIANQQITEQIKQLSEQSQLSDLMDYNVAGGSLTDQQAARHWLSTQGILLDNKGVSLCSGAQHGLMVLINTLTEYGDSIAVEALCYPGIISLAKQFGRKLIPISMDEEGMRPQSLEAAIEQHDIKLLIVVASHQNPTTSVMPISRRQAIADIVIKNNMWMIDDDVYGFLSPELPAISNFAPKHGFYLSSLSKCIFPGLRVGFIVYPEVFKQRIEATIRNTIWMPVPLTLAIAAKLMFSGQALAIQHQQSEIARKRQTIARQILKAEELSVKISSQINSFHLWLTLPTKWKSEAFSKALEKRGVLVSSADYFMADENIINRISDKVKACDSFASQSAVRISLMAAKSEDELKFALHIIKELLKD
jgi:DNA-binding transcriptional MocR family regulator